MKVKRIVVDEKPDCCWNCLFQDLDVWSKWECTPMQRTLEDSSGVPDWCPLVTEPYITIKEHTHYLTVHDWDIKDGTLTVDFEVKHEN